MFDRPVFFGIALVKYAAGDVRADTDFYSGAAKAALNVRDV